MIQEEIYKLHQKYASSEKILEIGWNHSLIVKEIAIQIVDTLKNKYGIEVDRDLIKTGALIHDIGYYQYFDGDKKNKKKYVEHGEIGGKILLKEGFLVKEIRFALTHVGVGYKQNIPITLEEEIVCYADNFHSKGHPGFDTFKNSVKEMKKHNPDFEIILNRFREKFGVPDLKELKEKYKKWHEEINRWMNSVK